jgi:hypothetical protein
VRFIVKWNNGSWKIFDTQSHSDVCLASRQKDAVASAEKMNAPRSPK